MQEERYADLSTGGIVTTGGYVIKADRGIKKKPFGNMAKVGGSGGIGKVGGERINTNIITDVVKAASTAVPLIPASAPGVAGSPNAAANHDASAAAPVESPPAPEAAGVAAKKPKGVKGAAPAGPVGAGPGAKAVKAPGHLPEPAVYHMFNNSGLTGRCVICGENQGHQRDGKGKRTLSPFEISKEYIVQLSLPNQYDVGGSLTVALRAKFEILNEKIIMRI